MSERSPADPEVSRHDDLLELQENEQRMRLLVASVQDYAILMLDPAGHVTTWNLGAERIKGYTAEEIIGRHFSVFYPPEDVQAGKPQWELEVAASRGRLEDEGWRVRKDGTCFWANVVITALRAPDGTLRGYGKVTRDLSERRAAELELARLASIFESADVAITGTTLSGTINNWNRAAEKLYGYTAEEAIGEPVSLIAPVDRRAEALELTERIKRGEAVEVETVRVAKDGRTIEVLLTISPVLGRDGQLVGVSAIHRDITERNRMEAELRASREQALDASRLKSEFVANMSHEIRTPLNGVMTMSELLLDTELTDDQREYAQVGLRSAEALMTIVNDILDFSKLEAGKLEVLFHDFAIEAVLEEICQLVRVQVDAKGLELVVSIDPDVPEVIRGDAARLRQVLLNLVGNAVKFTGDGEVVVDLGLARDANRSEELRIEVSDTGIGIDPDRIAALFEPFSQADATTTRRYGGTGLGLAIAKQLVELMGGQIGAHSSAGEGSMFWLTLPCERGASAEAPAASRHLTGVRLLIVDDNTTSRRVLERQVAGWGMVPTGVDRGSAALELLHRAADQGRPYEAALIDMKMPEMDGFELAREIRSVARLRSPRLILLGSASVSAREARAAGIDATLAKPVRQSRLYDQIVETLQRARRDRGDVGVGIVRVVMQEPESESLARRVLIAEDNEINQLAATRLLRKLGLVVDVANNGREAIEMTARTDYAAVFMDCQMPEIDGYAATRAIRRREGDGRHTPIIALTAHSMDGAREKCLEAGMDEYLSKPLRLGNIRTLLEQLPALGPAPRIQVAVDHAAFDPDGLAEIDDPTAVQAIITMFITQTDEKIAQIASAIGADNWATAHEFAHGLKGSAATLGAVHVAALSDTIARLSRAQPTPNAEAQAQIQQSASDLPEAFRQATAAMHTYIGRLSHAHA